ncbi:MAG: hypothetical protein AAF845_20500, partial [Bacteroidota bacterium]
MRTTPGTPAPVARAEALPEEGVGPGSPTPWLVGALLSLVAAALGGSQHVARAFAFDPRLGVPQVALPEAAGPVLVAVAALLGVG